MASKKPTEDLAEYDAFFPSDHSLKQYVPPKTDFDGAEQGVVAQAPNKILVIATDERYLIMENGLLFSTGNHPVETLLPIMHLTAAGYQIEVATASGNLAKLEMWAMPEADDAVQEAYHRLLPKLRRPKKLADVVADELGPDSSYAAVFVPGGHGAMINLAELPEVGQALRWAVAEDRFVITLCHGPAALLAARSDDGSALFAGYEAAVFPDALDAGANVDLGYLPGPMPWLLGERLRQNGIVVINDDMAGTVHADRQLLTGDNPLAANALGRLAVTSLTGDSAGAEQVVLASRNGGGS